MEMKLTWLFRVHFALKVPIPNNSTIFVRKILLIPSHIMLKNGQTYFKNLGV